ncbi:hypothetical protein FTO70_12030 [Methanosarcina sp. KYL-1]|uniref:hypothetical protein n=1 Tax=Methanosarcina sp. KYL-1 TaxID=2602068 RepID=UPI002100F8F0|nr:hypothetical protein [Methanosarcina sp. KYL-1]MCQ1536387.1 hypothetical protein [Methanosarcina sp. KYL-1]
MILNGRSLAKLVASISVVLMLFALLPSGALAGPGPNGPGDGKGLEDQDRDRLKDGSCTLTETADPVILQSGIYQQDKDQDRTHDQTPDDCDGTPDRIREHKGIE